MTHETEKQLMSFHFGAVSEQDRLLIEQRLLLDPEVLVKYLDLKRVLENFETVPQTPSPQVWARLQSQFKKPIAWILSFALGAAAAAIIVVLINLENSTLQPDQHPEQPRTHIIFDSSRELPAGSNVL